MTMTSVHFHNVRVTLTNINDENLPKIKDLLKAPYDQFSLSLDPLNMWTLHGVSFDDTIEKLSSLLFQLLIRIELLGGYEIRRETTNRCVSTRTS